MIRFLLTLILIQSSTLFAQSSFTSESGNIVLDPGNDGLNTMIIDVGGNVGIGELSAGNTLYVAGNVQIDGTTHLTDFTNTGVEEYGFITISANYTASDKSYIFADTSSSNIKITLPSAALSIGATYVIKKLTNDSQYVRITASDNINGDPDVYLKDLYTVRPSLEVISDGTTWRKIGGEDGLHWPQGDYMLVDISSGPTGTSYPVTYQSAAPDLTGTGNFAFKSNVIVLKWIPAGVFTMGNTTVSSENSGNAPEHEVTLTEGFWMGVFEVTQLQWLQVMGSHAAAQSNNTGLTTVNPENNVSWNDIRGDSTVYDWPIVRGVGPNTFMGNLLAKTGLPFDLPTEAQWEYACRAGTTTLWSYGNTEDGNYMWYTTNNTPSGTKEVGGKLPNPWGLYDMHGNVYEWCRDWYGASYYSASTSDDPDGITSGSSRVRRGGWSDSASFTRSADRSYVNPSNRNFSSGFRLSVSQAK